MGLPAAVAVVLVMEVSARRAAVEDLEVLVALYRALEREMTNLHPMWPLADGLSEPVEAALIEALVDSLVYVGEIDGYPAGFAIARIEDLLPQGGGEMVGSFRFIFTELEAREVGVGEALLTRAMDELRAAGVCRFDAHVLPGHRLAKNFFEAGGFSARHIVMYHHDVD
jgi:GNAT superfamily N-acetyltransferase